MFSTTTRETAINAVHALLNNLPMHVNKGNLEDAMRMVDREIGGLLGHPDSPVVSIFRSNQQILFPGGLEKTCQGRDIVLVLNSQTIKIKNPAGLTVSYSIPKALKNPEKGVAQIIGIDLAKKLFLTRASILAELFKRDPRWQPNVDANTEAQSVLNDYPYMQAKSIMKDILKNAATEIEKKRFVNGLELLDSGIRSLLAQPQSKMSCAISRHSWLFSKGVIAPTKGKDVISVLNGAEIPYPVKIGKVPQKTKTITSVPKELKNPEKGLVNTLGLELTIQLFTTRKTILVELVKDDKNWQPSLQANKSAEHTISAMATEYPLKNRP